MCLLLFPKVVLQVNELTLNLSVIALLCIIYYPEINGKKIVSQKTLRRMKKIPSKIDINPINKVNPQYALPYCFGYFWELWECVGHYIWLRLL